MEELMAYVKPVMAVIPVSGSGAAIAATAVTAVGYNRVCFLLSVGEMGTGAEISCQVTESASSGGTYATAATTAALTTITTTGKNKIYCIDVHVNSDKPYLKLYGTCGTAASLHSAIALLYQGSGKLHDPKSSTIFGQYLRKY